jgi:hypothetical protein
MYPPELPQDFTAPAGRRNLPGIPTLATTPKPLEINAPEMGTSRYNPAASQLVELVPPARHVDTRAIVRD